MTVPASIRARTVNEVFMDCLFKDEEIEEAGKPPEGAVLIEGITMKVGFHPERLEKNKDLIRQILNDMDPAFHVGGGGGFTFLNLCVDKDGAHWGEHKNMEELILLGIATKMAAYCTPREMWSAFPGGLPYIVISTDDPAKLPPTEALGAAS